MKPKEGKELTGLNEAKSIDDGPHPVSFFRLYRFASPAESAMLVAGLLFGVVCGLGTPINSILLGDLTGSMVHFSAARGRPANTTGPGDDPTQELSGALLRYTVSMSAVGAVMLVCTYLSITIFNYAAQKQVFRIRSLYLQSVLHQEISWFDTNSTGEFASRMAEDMTKFEDGIGEKVVMCTLYVVSFVCSLVLSFIRGWELTLICLISLPLMMISMALVETATTKLAKKELELYARAGSIAEEVLGAIRTVVSFGGEQREVERYQSNLGAARNNNVKRGLICGLGFGILWLCIYASYALSFWYGVGLILEHRYDVSTMVTVFFGVMMGSMCISFASPYLETFSTAKGAAAKVFSVIDRRSQISSMSPEGKRPSSVEGHIQFKDIRFRYPSRPEVEVLRGLDLDIPAGQTVALVGNSGCGKSTCVQLLQRLYDPAQGSVLLDGRDIRDLNVAWLRGIVGMVGQEPVLFQTSVAENVRHGNEAASLDDVVSAAKEANAHEFVERLPQAYDTLVGERGAQLSGGQKQRIAIARALVRKPRLLLLDEATSALDSGSEAAVQAALDKASKGRTTVIIAHRLSTVRHADKIAVLVDGRVAEQGSHEELMRLGGHYHALVAAQAGTVGELTVDNADEMDTARQTTVVKNLTPGDSEGGDAPALADEPSVTGKREAASTVVRLLCLNSPEWKSVCLASLCSIIVGCAYPIYAVLFGDIIGNLVLNDPEQVREQTNLYCVYFIVAGVVVGATTFAQIFFSTLAGEALTTRLRRMLFAAMLRQEVAWFDDEANSTGALCAKLSADTSTVQGATGQRLGTILQSAATIVLGVALAMVYEWRLGLTALAWCPVILVTYYFSTSMEKGGRKTSRKSVEKATKVAVEAVGNVRTVASLGRERGFHEDYLRELAAGLGPGLRETHARGLVFALAQSVEYFAFAAVFYYGGRLVAGGEMEFAEVLKTSNSLIIGTLSIANALAYTPNFEKGIAAAGRIFKLLDRKPKITDPDVNSTERLTCGGSVQFSGVEFSYPARRSAQVLQGLSLAVRQGQTVALVGPSGCGKSTCIQLLERFYDPAAGAVLIDDRDVSSVTLGDLRGRLGLVSQEPVLFNRSIAENIAYGDNSRSVVPMDEIVAAATKANIHEFISSLPAGYETCAGEKGTQLSGGQKQRVAIARALIRNPQVLLLDEATSALDTESEKVVQKALDAAMRGRTCIVIAHRLTTVQEVDVICVLNEGKVVETGTHAELLALRGAYHRLWCGLQGSRVPE